MLADWKLFHKVLLLGKNLTVKNLWMNLMLTNYALKLKYRMHLGSLIILLVLLLLSVVNPGKENLV